MKRNLETTAIASLVIASSMLLPTQSANSLCIYKGVDNAQTTIEQEYLDSKWVVKAKVLAAYDHYPSDEEEAHPTGDNDAWTIYKVKVVKAYKGQPDKTLDFLTLRNSGGFYMDRPWLNLPEAHDIGAEYLLFLNPNKRQSGDALNIPGTVFVKLQLRAQRAVGPSVGSVAAASRRPAQPSSYRSATAMIRAEIFARTRSDQLNRYDL